MPHATVIANPSTRAAPQLDYLLPTLHRLFQNHGFTVTYQLTTPAPHSAQHLATAALPTSQAIFALGGDGTAHAVAQALAGTGVPLGILPFGTHNAFARALGLSRQPHRALAQLLPLTPTLIPLGEITTLTETRVFLFMAGAGPTAALAHHLARPSRFKRLLGPAAYPLGAARLFLTRRWPAFRVDYRLAQSPLWQTTQATSLLASRIPSLGGLFAGLTPCAALTDPHLHVHLLRAPAHLALPAWLTRLPNPWLQTLDLDELRCTPIPSATEVLLQTDAEPTGSLPCTLRVRPAALHLLLPEK